MDNLYKDLATVYEAMYHTFIDYKEEYDFYSSILQKYHKNAVLEIGSGTGNLAPYFIENGFEYIGLDYSQEMLSLAREKTPYAQFREGDMRDFQLDHPVQSTLITARTINHLLKNEDLMSAFKSINDNLHTGGILAFDFIDANEFIPFILGGKNIRHTANYQGIEYIRDSFWKEDLELAMNFEWDAIYYKKSDDNLIELGTDKLIVRAFTINELELFLTLNNFKIKEIIKRASYAFPTYVIVAEKIV